MDSFVPIPRTVSEMGDHVVGMLSAPDFTGFQRVVNYTITYEMMLNAFQEGLRRMPGRNKSPEVISLLAECASALEQAGRLFAEGQIDAGKELTYAAYRFFGEARRAINKKKTPPTDTPA